MRPLSPHAHRPRPPSPPSPAPPRVSGHTHNYQRTVAFAGGAPSDPGCLTSVGGVATYTSCRGTVAILAGSPGMNQGLGTRNAPAGILELALQAWGYGHLTVVNGTALRWQWFEVASWAGEPGASARRTHPWGSGAQRDEAWVLRAAA